MRRKGHKEKHRRVGGRGEKEEDRLAYERLKEWIETREPRRDPEEDRNIREFLAMDAGLLSGWISRLFQEGRIGQRERILEWASILLGGEAVLPLKEVIRCERCSLAERKTALDALRLLDPTNEEALGTTLDEAWLFVTEEFSGVMMGQTLEPGASWERVWERYQCIPKELSDSVVFQLMDYDPARAFSFLEVVLDRTGTLPDEVLQRMAEVPEEEAARFLQSAYRKASGKALRKKIKKVNHKRRARGLAFCDLETDTTGRAIWSPPVPPKPAALLSMSESPDSRMVWVIRHQVPKGILVFGGWVHDGQGLVKFFLLDLSQRETEKYRDSLLNNKELTVVEADPAYCAFLLDEAYGKSAPRDPEEAEMYKTYRGLLRELVPAEDTPHPIRQAFQDQADGVVTEDPLGESEALLKHKFLTAWQMDLVFIKPYLEKLQEISQSRIIVHPLQRQERIDAFYREATREILSDEASRKLWRRRVEDMAWVLFKTGEETLAKRLFQVGLYLEDTGRDCSRVTFFTHMVQRTLEGLLREKKSAEKETPSLIVKPS